jgi:hypothetical protein
MTAPELVVTMTARGVTFTVVGDRLRVEAPAGELTESDRNTLAAHKPALLVLLGSDQEREGSPAESDGVKVTRKPLGVDDALAVFRDARVVAIGQAATWPPEGGYLPASASSPGARVQTLVPQPVVLNRAPTHQQLDLWTTVKALGRRAVGGVGSFAVGSRPQSVVDS